MPRYNAVSYNVIYIFSIDDDAHRGKLKIGKTSFNSLDSITQLSPNCPKLQQASHQCIMGETHRAMVDYTLEYCELAIRDVTMRDGSVQQQAFWDHDVKSVLLNSGYQYVTFNDTGRTSEWFIGNLETAKRAIKAVKDGFDKLPNEQAQTDAISSERRIKLREEQERNIEKTINIFGQYDNMLWDCKMRYGKTVTAYEVIRRMNEKGLFKKVIVITHRPAVQDGWGEDHELIFGGTDHRFIDKTNGKIEFDSAIDAANDKELLSVSESGTPFVYFSSIQDLRGSARVGGRHNKNNAVFDMDWDLLIIDEAHEGTQTELGDAVISALKKGHTKVLSLSGTPYNIMQKYDENVFTWTYVDEQKAKERWAREHPNEKNPYEDLPRMNIFTFDITEQISNSYRYVTEDMAFNFREFFRTWTGDKERDYRDIPEGSKAGDFVYERDVDSFLSLISEDNPDSNYPFSTDEYREMFAHTFWMVPGVKEAKALSARIQSHPRFSEYHVVNIAGEGDEEQPYDQALNLVKSSIKAYDKTITISCGKLTTGITVREWTGIMMLSGSSSTAAGGYMQSIFRVQSPGYINGKQKTNCYVFDFAPDRTLKVIAEVHNLRHKRGGSDDEKAKDVLGEFINFCPIIAVEGNVMRTYDVPEMMRQIKRISVGSAINSGFDDDSIYKSDAGIVMDKYDTETLKKLADVVVPQKKSKKATSVIINNQGLTDEQRKLAERAKRKQKKELTPEEKEALELLKKQKEEQKKMFNLLRAVSIRLPLLFYGADADITEIIHLEDFVRLVDDESWTEFMPKGLRKDLFKSILKYYDEDVITGAGLRIRKLAKAADELPPVMRAKRIVEIISRFKNPDKETVLTPWRVVNMHLGDTIGGYNFFDEKFEHELDEPRLIEQGETTADILLNENARILEMNSKSGLYPLYMTYSLYMMYVDGDEKKYPLEEAQKIWFNTLEKNIFVLCKTKMARTITIRTLAGYSGKTVNAIYLSKLIDERMKNIPRLTNKLINPRTWGKEGEKMKFDAIIGNPPYQLVDGGSKASAVPVYNLFVDFAKDIAPQYISMIIPAKWYNGGRGLDSFRRNMLSDSHMHSLIDFEDSQFCFPGVDVAGGICYFLWDKKYQGKCSYKAFKNGAFEESSAELNKYDTFIRDPKAIPIIEKVKANSNGEYLSACVSSQKPFGLRTYVKPLEKGDIILRYNGGKGAYDSSEITVNKDLIYKWKVIMSYLTYDHAGRADKNGKRRIFSSMDLLKPGEICTETYIVIGTFDNENEANGLYKYLKTVFCRYMVSLVTSTQHLSKDNFRYVPMQNFDLNSDIDWSKSVPEIDKQLYKKYNLSEEEINYIEKMIKPME